MFKYEEGEYGGTEVPEKSFSETKVPRFFFPFTPLLSPEGKRITEYLRRLFVSGSQGQI